MHILLPAVAAFPSVAAIVQLQQPFPYLSNQSRKNILNPQVNAAIDSILKDFNSPGGLGIAVVRKDIHGWTVETKGYGIAKADGIKVTEDTLFSIGSNSKLFDILATGLLISNESLSTRMSWNTKIASVVPEWELMDPIASAESTIADVMSHRTGLPRHALISKSDAALDSIHRLKYLRPSIGFRELWQYNNHMYTLLSCLPPLLVGIQFEKYVNDFILAPLGMQSTTYSSEHAAKSGNLADGMARDSVNRTRDVFGAGRVRAIPYWAPSKDGEGHSFSGAGGVISNAKDMAIWLQALLNEGRHPMKNDTVIPAEVIRKVATGLTVASPVATFPELSPVVYGGGQSRGTYRGFEFIEHGGDVPGFHSQVTRIPTENFGVAVLCNDDSFGVEIVAAIRWRIMDEALKLKAIDWSGRLKSGITENFNNRILPTPRPEKATLPSLPLAALAGRYHDPGYGTMNLCLVSQDNQSSASKSCRRLLEEIPTRLPDILDPQIPTLLTKWDGHRATHLAFAHFEHNIFNVSEVFSIPTGNSSDKPYWVSTDMALPSFEAEFSSDGVGLRGLWGAGDGVQSPTGDTIKARSEVWFRKVDEA
ncbi:beta-lactamase/transpeptidase-like protein [Mycena epipterygia]|nr:beta-lactamase/transpeptidase-like protein [Mycena epipterygia]